MEKFLTYLKTYWFLIVAFFTMSVAWGQSQLKIQTLEEAVKETATTQQQVQALKEQVARTDERTQLMLDSQIRQERLIENILLNQQKLIKLLHL